ncbi:DUF4352 domain-containing protein [Desulfosporosinus youngiae]|uniref:Telomeric repeat-binding factor 2 n=1 Tax=Desulfosporosinus youngiae DSM 17734 TaxID=768710 RepID=H5Y2G6_9FIRM|nr:DUF4352 domain-containing protein [Desulfosporosinus youngiae]EHQ88657.1 Telomeric repeat-binding factor 2 [Desulfosporosinus youngiae DSM 17734]
MKRKLINWIILVAAIGMMQFVIYPTFIAPYTPINTGDGSSKIGDTVTVDNLEYTINQTKSDAYSGGTLAYILGTGKKTVHVSVTIKNSTKKDYSFNVNLHFVVIGAKKDSIPIPLSTTNLNQTILAGGTIQGEFSYEAQSNHKYFIMNILKNTNDEFDPSAEIALINLVTP